MKNQLMRVFSLIVVLFIILGIPALLITISNPLAALDTVGGSIASIDGSITFLLQVFIPLIAWVGWASLVIPLITETIARARRVDAVQLPGILRVQQNVAAVLIGLIFASGAGFSNAVAVEAASSAAPAPVATSVSAPATVQAQQAAPNASEMRQASQSGPSYMVNGAQTLWGIAETTLGDGTRWNEIFLLNQNVVQNDGQTLTSPDQWLNDGWVLTLPQDAKIPQLIHPEQSVTIQPGDTLSEIALEHYGDLEAYHFIAGESARQVQPDGTMIQDADLIQPGWQFTLPGAPPLLLRHLPQSLRYPRLLLLSRGRRRLELLKLTLLPSRVLLHPRRTHRSLPPLPQLPLRAPLPSLLPRQMRLPHLLILLPQLSRMLRPLLMSRVLERPQLMDVRRLIRHLLRRKQ